MKVIGIGLCVLMAITGLLFEGAARGDGTAPTLITSATAGRDGLKKMIAGYSAERVPLQKVLADLSAQAGVSVEVDWVRLYEAGVRRGTLVSVAGDKQELGAILRAVLEGTRAEKPLSFTAEGSLICISTLSDLRSRYQAVRTFDITPLLGNVELTSREGIQIQRAFLRTLIAAVAPETWQDNGGNIGTARTVNGTLIVNQSFDVLPAVEKEVQAMLAASTPVTRVYDVHELVRGYAVSGLHSKIEELMGALQAACSPGSWCEGRNTMSAFEGKLLVSATPGVQTEIEATLGKLRGK